MKWKEIKHLLFTRSENLSSEENKLRIRIIAFLFGTHFLLVSLFCLLVFKPEITSPGIAVPVLALFISLVFYGIVLGQFFLIIALIILTLFISVFYKSLILAFNKLFF